jgi:DNA replication protein DnaC
MVTAKRQETEGRESAISQLFGLKSFVPQKGSTNNEYTNKFDLMKQIIEYLLDGKQRSNTVLFGESGSGKSLFLIKLM